MNKIFSSITFCLFFICWMSCKDNDPKKQWAIQLYGSQTADNASFINSYNDSLVTIKVKNDDLERGIINLSEIIEEYQYVPLQTSDSILIGLIDKIIVKHNRIYILDQRQAKSIFIFDWQGRSISIINRKGKGPGEYLSLKDMSVTSDGNILIFDSDGHKVIKYDEKGNFRWEQRTTFYFSYLSCIKNDSLIFSTEFCSQNYHLPGLHCHNLLFADSNMLLRNKALPYNEKNLLLRVTSGSDFFFSGNTQFYSPYLQDTVYQIAGGKLFSKYAIQFDKNSLSRFELMENEKLTSTDAGFEIYDKEREIANYTLHPFAFSNRITYFPVSHNQKVSSVFYDLKSNKVYAGNKYDLNGVKNCIAYASPQVGYENYLIGTINAPVFVAGWRALKEKIKVVSNGTSELYDKIKKDDNPVIFFAKTR